MVPNRATHHILFLSAIFGAFLGKTAERQIYPSYLFEFSWTLGHKVEGDLLLNLIDKCMFTIKTLDEYGDCCAECVKSQKVSKLRQSMWLWRLFNPLKTNCPII